MARRARRRYHRDFIPGGAYFAPSVQTLPRDVEIIPSGYQNERWSFSSADTVDPWYPRRRFVETPTPRGFVFGASPQAPMYRRQASVYRRRLGVSPQAGRLVIRVPSRVKFCVARKQRRQVLFALDRAGYSGSSTKRHYFRSEESNYRC